MAKINRLNVVKDENFRDMVEAVCNGCKHALETFSAHDITRKVRELVGNAINIEHDDVKPYVQSWYLKSESNYKVSNHPDGYLVYLPKSPVSFDIEFVDAALESKPSVKSNSFSDTSFSTSTPQSTAVKALSGVVVDGRYCLSFMSMSGIIYGYDVSQSIYETVKRLTKKPSTSYGRLWQYVKDNAIYTTSG